MKQYYLAVDIGASSGRHILAHREDGKMVLEEIHRFPNGMQEKNGKKIWDVEQLFEEILTGMKKCKKLGKIPQSVGIDTWAVDFVLLDKEGKRLGDAVGYRDKRTEGMDEKVYEVLSEKELYARTGIQKQIFNTVYQLMAVKNEKEDLLTQADKLLMIPDYFHYLLTGKAVSEYTNATTTQLVNPVTKDWDKDLIRTLGYPVNIFTQIVKPGTDIGPLKEEIAEKIGYNCHVVLPATHDTGSAVMAVPVVTDVSDSLYISSGTWSLMGTEQMFANCGEESRIHNLTSEGGYNYRFRYLKNIMGLWMIQSVKKEIAQEMSFDQICKQAADCSIASIVDCNDDRFLAPENMTKEVQDACRESNQQVPETVAEVAAVIYNSLAKCYARVSDINTGMYLVCMKPFEWNGEHYQALPYLISFPTLITTSDSLGNQQQEWNYDLIVDLKLGCKKNTQTVTEDMPKTEEEKEAEEYEAPQEPWRVRYKTGDEENLVFWGGITVLFGGIFIGLCICEKHRKKQDEDKQME